MTRYDGYNGQVEVTESTLTITREGLVARATFGKSAPPRQIALSSIGGVRHQPATRLKNGWLQLLLGGQDAPPLSVTSAPSNADTVVFTHKQQDAFAALAGWLEQVAHHNLATGGPTPVHTEISTTPPGLQGRLEQLAARAAVKADEARARQTTFQAEVAQARAASAGVSTQGALFTGHSRDEGRNAIVVLFPDRIERVKPKKVGAFSNAHQDVEMTPIRSVTSVQARKDGFHTKVTVYASGNTIEFRFGHAEAAKFKEEIQRLLLSGPPPAQAPQAPVVDVADQLTKLADLRDRGILTEAEFAAQKAKLLGM